LRKIFLEQRLKGNNDKEGQREDEKQPPLHAGILLGIREVCQNSLLGSFLPGRLLLNQQRCDEALRLIFLAELDRSRLR
jgi:hypothetical protein